MDRIVLITKATGLSDMVREYMTEGAAAFALETLGQSIAPLRGADRTYRSALETIQRELPNDIPVMPLTRDELPDFLFRDTDMVMVCGPDGLFVNVAKHLREQPIIGVNPDPDRITGVLLPFRPHEAGAVVASVHAGKHRIERVPLAKATIDDVEVVWGVNDIFIGRNDQASAVYTIAYGGYTERQSSSGIIVSTGIGTTGWMRSVATMLERLCGSAGALTRLPRAGDQELFFVVRESFPSASTGTRLVAGRVTRDLPLTVTSEMASGGCVFSDGVLERRVPFDAGSSVVVTVGNRFVNRVVRSS